MPHPKHRLSKQRKRKRRTHQKLDVPTIATCSNTGESHLWHRAYWHEGNMYYKGNLVIQVGEESEA